MLTHLLPYHHRCVCVRVPVSCSEVVPGYCYGSRFREAASRRQELGQFWQNLDCTVYNWKQIKSAESKRRELHVFIQRLISVRSDGGFTANLLHLRAKYKTSDYSSLSTCLGPSAPCVCLLRTCCYFFLRERKWALSDKTHRHLSHTLLLSKDVTHLVRVFRCC